MTTYRIAMLMLTLGLFGCVHLDSVSTSSVPADRSRSVETTETRFLFFLFNTNNDYVDRLVPSLAQQCPTGRVEGILTKKEVVTYFPIIAHLIRVKAQGYCVSGEAVQ